MKHLLKTWLPLAVCFQSMAISAQVVDSFQLMDNGKPLPLLRGISANNRAGFDNITLRESSFPVVILPEESVRSTVNSFNAKDRLIMTLQEENRLLSHRDTLSTLESRKLRDLIAVHERHIGLCDSTNAILNRSIMGLNAQLDETRQLAKDCNKMRSAKSIWATVLGGGIGFGLGILIGIIAN
ncbi:MAG: hypothetical protein EPGJADBJ_03641 [Saprospiraceae bacterium]|nr:hypothetical protein [Saprospiraceae bacterium]